MRTQQINSQPGHPILLRRRDAANAIAVGLSKLDELTTTGELPHVRIGRCLRYRREDLEAFAKKQKRIGVGT